MNYFCNLRSLTGTIFYGCAESQCILCKRYQAGEIPPQFSVPAVRVKVGFHRWSWLQPYPSAYWYIASHRLLWSIYERWGFIEEKA